MRETLIEQVAYLRDEIAALRPVIADVPAEVAEARPIGGSESLKELYGRMVEETLIARDAVSDSRPERSGMPGRDWDERDLTDILDALDEAREDLVQALEGLPPDSWEEGGAGRRAAEGVLERDLACQRVIAERLSERAIGPG